MSLSSLARLVFSPRSAVFLFCLPFHLFLFRLSFRLSLFHLPFHLSLFCWPCRFASPSLALPKCPSLVFPSLVRLRFAPPSCLRLVLPSRHIRFSFVFSPRPCLVFLSRLVRYVGPLPQSCKPVCLTHLPCLVLSCLRLSLRSSSLSDLSCLPSSSSDSPRTWVSSPSSLVRSCSRGLLASSGGGCSGWWSGSPCRPVADQALGLNLDRIAAWKYCALSAPPFSLSKRSVALDRPILIFMVVMMCVSIVMVSILM